MRNKKMRIKLIKIKLHKHEAVLSRLQLAAFLLIFAAIGTGFLLFSKAATPTLATVEAEQMTLPAGASIVVDTTASGGKAVKLSQSGTSLNGSVSFATTATSLSITAHGSKCRGGWPTMTILVDNNPVTTNMSVKGNGWGTSTFTVSLDGSTHALSIKDTAVNPCSSLYIDKVVLYGPAPVTPPTPTISFSASPNSVSAGSSSTLTWNSTNATGCNATGGWNGTQPVTGSASTGALNITTTYNLSCTGAGGTANASAIVTVAASPTVSSIYWGARMDGEVYCNGCTNQDAPWYAPTWNTFEANTGKKVSINHFGQPAPWNQAFTRGPFDLITTRGAIPFMTMGSDDVSLAGFAGNATTAGSKDASLIAWAQAAKTYGKPFLFRWNWEMNGGWYSWGQQAKANPADYVAAWRHFHKIVNDAGATNVTWVWCPNTIFDGSTDLKSLYPGDDVVDWTCIDGYNFGYRKGPWKSFYNVYKPTYDKLVGTPTAPGIAPSKPILIAEIASTEAVVGSDPTGVSKSAWITDALKTQLPNNFPQIKGLVWFNWNITEKVNMVDVKWDWQIESSPASQAAFADGIASPYYHTNNFGNLPPLTKVKAP